MNLLSKRDKKIEILSNKIVKTKNEAKARGLKKKMNVLKSIKTIRNEREWKYYKNKSKIAYYDAFTNEFDISSNSNFFKYKIAKKSQFKALGKNLILKAKASDRKTEEEKNLISAINKANKQKYLRLFLKSFLYLFLISYAVITLYPFIWAVAGSFRPESEFANAGLNPFPKEWTAESYKYLFTSDRTHFSQWIWNSAWTATLGVFVNLALNTLAGYALARFRFKGRNQIFWGMLILAMVPAQVLMIPNFLIIKKFRLYNNLLALIVPSAVNIGYIFMSRQFFLNFPQDVEEAASIDGMSRLKTLWKIVVPLMRPMIITQSIFLFMGFWNNFLNARIYLNSSEKFTLPLGIQDLISSTQYETHYSQVLAASVISIVPVLAIYIGLNGVILKGQRSDGDK